MGPPGGRVYQGRPTSPMAAISPWCPSIQAAMGSASIPLHACAITAVTGVLRAGGDVFWSTALDIVPQWAVCLPATALAALVFRLGCWPIAFAIQLESVVKFPLCLWRVQGGKWINDVTGGERGG